MQIKSLKIRPIVSIVHVIMVTLFCQPSPVVCFTLLLFPLNASAAELHMWVDEKGVKHITSQPPEKPAQIIGKETYKKDSPEEIQRYQAGEKAKEQRRDAELRQMQQANRAQEEANQVSANNTSKTLDSAYEIKRKELEDNFSRAYKEYQEGGGESQRAAMFKAQKAEHDFVFSPENYPKDRAIKTTITTKGVR